MKKFLTVFIFLIFVSVVTSTSVFSAKYNINSTGIIIDIPSEYGVVTSSNIDSFNYTKEEKENIRNTFSRENIALWATNWKELYEFTIRSSRSKMAWDYKELKNPSQTQLNQIHKVLESTLNLKVNDVHIETINSTNFIVANSIITSSGTIRSNIYQKHYLTVINGQTIGINAAYYGKYAYDFPSDELRKIINTISYTEFPNPNTKKDNQKTNFFPGLKKNNYQEKGVAVSQNNITKVNVNNNDTGNTNFSFKLGEAVGVSAAIFPEILIMIFLLKRSIYTSIKLFEPAIIISVFIGFLKYNGLPTDIIAVVTIVALLIVIGMYLFFVAARHFNKKKKE